MMVDVTMNGCSCVRCQLLWQRGRGGVRSNNMSEDPSADPAVPIAVNDSVRWLIDRNM